MAIHGITDLVHISFDIKHFFFTIDRGILKITFAFMLPCYTLSPCGFQMFALLSNLLRTKALYEYNALSFNSWNTLQLVELPYYETSTLK